MENDLPPVVMPPSDASWVRPVPPEDKEERKVIGSGMLLRRMIASSSGGSAQIGMWQESELVRIDLNLKLKERSLHGITSGLP